MNFILYNLQNCQGISIFQFLTDLLILTITSKIDIIIFGSFSVEKFVFFPQKGIQWYFHKIVPVNIICSIKCGLCNGFEGFKYSYFKKQSNLYYEKIIADKILWIMEQCYKIFLLKFMQ